MTQKEKIARAAGFAHYVKSVASTIEFDCKDYDETWALSYCRDLCDAADELLKAFGK